MFCICKTNLEYLKSAYFSNVIVVDWSWYSNSLNYFWVVRQIPLVSKEVTEMIDFLSTQGLDCSKMAVVGHSLGAHMLSIAAYKAACKVARMVALDPARPKFEGFEDPRVGVSQKSANFVEVIHTNADAYGIMQPRGHLDFFINGGVSQPGCEDSWLKRAFNYWVSDDASQCAHSRAYIYYAESINSEKGFYGLRCPDKHYERNMICDGPVEEMSGPNLKSHILGTFYVPVNDKEPFALGIKPDKMNFDIVKDQQIQFNLYCGMLFAGTIFNLENSCFNASWITVFAVHGWNTTYDKSFDSIKDGKKEIKFHS